MATGKQRPTRQGFAPSMGDVRGVALVAVAIAVATIALLYVIADHVVPAGDVSSRRTVDVAKISIALAGLVGAVLTGVDAYRRQRLSEGEALRQDAEHLLGRFSKASDQLGHSSAAVRLAGVLSMAALADDWPAQRQLCINMLTAYLQLPYEPNPDHTNFVQGEREIRRSLTRLIRDHLRDGMSEVSWCGHDFRFERAVLDGGDLTGARFTSGNINFHGARFVEGTFHFNKVSVEGARVWFTDAVFEGGEVHFDGVQVKAGSLDFTGASVHGGVVTFAGFATAGGEVEAGPFADRIG